MSAKPVSTTANEAERITPDDLRDRFNALQGEVDSTTESAKGLALAAGAVVAVAVVLGVFILGARRGRKRTTVVEIRRV